MQELKVMIQEIEETIKDPLLLIYNKEEELENKDVFKIIEFIKNVGSKECSLIISGEGGHFSPAIDLGSFLKDRFKSGLITYIPEQASSAFGYIVLLSKKAFCCNNYPLSQIDLTFEKGGKTYRAKEELNNKNKNIREDAHLIWTTSAEIFNKILSMKYTLCKKSLNERLVLKLMDICMRDSQHKKSIELNKLKKMNLNICLIEEDLNSKLKKMYDKSLSILKKENKRFIVASNKFIFKY